MSRLLWLLADHTGRALARLAAALEAVHAAQARRWAAAHPWPRAGAVTTKRGE